MLLPGARVAFAVPRATPIGIVVRLIRWAEFVLKIGIVRPKGEGVVAVFHGDEDEDEITAGSWDGSSAEGAESFAVRDGGAEGEGSCFQFLPLAELLGFEDEFTGGFSLGVAELDFGDVFKETEGKGADGEAFWLAFRILGGEGEGRWRGGWGGISSEVTSAE